MRQVLFVMMTIALLLPAAGFAEESTPAEGTQPTSPFFTSFEEAQAAAREGNKPIILDFYTDW